jgi:thioredoxin 1
MSDRSQRAGRFTVGLGCALALAAGLAGAAPAAAADAGRGRPSHAAPREAGQVVKVSGFSFEREVLRSELPVIVDFWAPWCIVCRELDAPLAAVAAKFAGRARVVRVNVDWSSRVASRYDVRSLPTLLVFAHGEMVSRSIGGASETDLEEMLTAQLAPAPVTVAAAGAVPAPAAGAGR